MLADVEWSELRSDIESNTTHNEPAKVDLPLHHVITESDGDINKTAPPNGSPTQLGKTIPATLRSDHGVLRFSGDSFEK